MGTPKTHWAIMDELFQAMRKMTYEESCRRPTLQQAVRADTWVWLNLREMRAEGLAAQSVARQFPLDSSFAKLAKDPDFRQILRPIPMADSEETRQNEYATIFGCNIEISSHQ